MCIQDIASVTIVITVTSYEGHCILNRRYMTVCSRAWLDITAHHRWLFVRDFLHKGSVMRTICMWSFHKVIIARQVLAWQQIMQVYFAVALPIDNFKSGFAGQKYHSNWPTGARKYQGAEIISSCSPLHWLFCSSHLLCMVINRIVP